ncbi:hypothetical protein AAVH_42927, partial [Aphelenchoides avenae]
ERQRFCCGPEGMSHCGRDLGELSDPTRSGAGDRWLSIRHRFSAILCRASRENAPNASEKRGGVGVPNCTVVAGRSCADSQRLSPMRLRVAT